MKHEALWRAARLLMNTVATDDEKAIREQLAALDAEAQGAGLRPKRKAPAKKTAKK